jgi:hypothetical protein
MLKLKNKPKAMTMTEIKNKAKNLGINPGKMKKVQLIHEIQKTEGNYPCFGSAVDWCEHSDCCFMNDCFKTQL